MAKILRLVSGLIGKLRKLGSWLRGSQVIVLIGVFVVGVALGMILKVVAERTVIIGFEDYLIDMETEYMDLNAAAMRVKKPL